MALESVLASSIMASYNLYDFYEVFRWNLNSNRFDALFEQPASADSAKESKGVSKTHSPHSIPVLIISQVTNITSKELPAKRQSDGSEVAKHDAKAEVSRSAGRTSIIENHLERNKTR
jgi:hypothetical protein